MKKLSILEITNSTNQSLVQLLLKLKSNPYSDYSKFKKELSEMINQEIVPTELVGLCGALERAIKDGIYVHYIKNCPIDPETLVLDVEDPRTDKINRKNTFVSEGFLELFSQLRNTPVFSYETRNNGDFFQDVYPWSKFSHTNTVRSSKNVTWHNDRTAHSIRAHYLYLLGIHVPHNDQTITNYIDYTELVKKFSDKEVAVLKQKYFYTEFDDISKTYNKSHQKSDCHPIFDSGTVRFYESNTRVSDSSPPEASAALNKVKKVLYETEKTSVKIETGGLLCLPNKKGLHSREVISQPSESQRWLIKTYNFGSFDEYLSYKNIFKENHEGMVRETG